MINHDNANNVTKGHAVTKDLLLLYDLVYYRFY